MADTKAINQLNNLDDNVEKMFNPTLKQATQTAKKQIGNRKRKRKRKRKGIIVIPFDLFARAYHG